VCIPMFIVNCDIHLILVIVVDGDSLTVLLCCVVFDWLVLCLCCLCCCGLCWSCCCCCCCYGSFPCLPSMCLLVKLGRRPVVYLLLALVVLDKKKKKWLYLAKKREKNV
jgi:hypothetical protein